jgi:hypothetical protein
MNSAVEQLVADPASIDLGAWAAAAEGNANRAGLIACGDVVAAARELVKEARATGTRPETAILDLARWSVTLSLRTGRRPWLPIPHRDTETTEPDEERKG